MGDLLNPDPEEIKAYLRGEIEKDAAETTESIERYRAYLADPHISDGTREECHERIRDCIQYHNLRIEPIRRMLERIAMAEETIKMHTLIVTDGAAPTPPKVRAPK